MNSETVKIEQRPTTGLSDLNPNMYQSSDGSLTIEGDPILNKIHWFSIWVISFVFGLGLPMILKISLKDSENRFALAIWELIVFSLPFFLLSCFPTKLKMNRSTQQITFETRLPHKQNIIIPFNEIKGIYRKKVYYETLNSRLPPSRTEMELAYLEINQDSTHLGSIGRFLGEPILCTNKSTMDLFLKNCELNNLKIR